MSYLKIANIHAATVFTLQHTQFVCLMYVNCRYNYNARQSL
jgi:hypothetical protein